MAEVLITLSIIGVIAALTMPSLVANHRKQVVETRLAKVYSVMNQAINMSVAENGPAADWIIDCGLSTSPTCSSDDVEKWFKEYIGKYLKILKTEPVDNGLFVYFPDGGILSINNYIYDMVYAIDKNALENGKAGVNYFSFRFNPVLLTGQNIENNEYTQKSTFEPYAWNWDGTIDGLLHSTYQYGCGEKYSSYCAKLIQMNGWKIPKNYPIKF